MNEFDIAEPETQNSLTPLGKGLGVLKMRDYQIEAVDCIYDGWQDYDAIAIEVATGLGKTALAAETIIRWPGQGRILFIAHVVELIEQGRETIGLHIDEMPSTEMGEYSEVRDGGHPILDRSRVLVASIQTMSRRMAKFNPKDFDVIIIDEFHHGGAKSYRALWSYFKEGNPDIKMLGITATLFRADNISLSCMAEKCVFVRGIREGIDDGWLVPIKQKYVVVDGLDFSQCRTLAKDLNESDLESAMLGGKADDGMTDEERKELLIKQERMLHAVAAPSVEEAAGRPGLVFCVTVDHAMRMAEILRRYPDVTAEVIHGGTDKDLRKETIKRYKQGKVQFLVGVGCFLEGFDAPNTQVLVCARPTKSKSVYIQLVGRGTRPVSGLVDRFDTPDTRRTAIGESNKPFVTILDFVGNSGRHKLISTADVLAGDMPEEFVRKAVEEMQREGNAEDVRERAWKKKVEHDAEVRKREEERRQREQERMERARAIEEARRAKLIAQAQYHTREVDAFTPDAVPERAQPKFRGGSSDSQIRFLVQLGIKEETAMGWTKPQASAVINKLANQTGSQFIMRFGKHAGKMLKDIPTPYLKWMGESVRDEQVQQNIASYREEIAKHQKGDAWEGD